ncbi:MAG: NAD(P)/FAD-dependent oxidoreductase [Bacilli bacterium]
MKYYDTIVIGGGPAGLAASCKASENGSVLLIEREGKLGGILKQCIHDGFGVTRFKTKLSGPEYAYREIESIKDKNVEVSLLTFVTSLKKEGYEYVVTFVNTEGVGVAKTQKLILSTGCRERTSKQIFIHGTNPCGVMSAGQAQYYINVMGKMPLKNAVILGSGDIGLIMARRITLEGGHVEGVYEVKSTPSGLTRNIVQCLEDFNIPLHLSHTVTRVFGTDRLEEVEVAEVDNRMNVVEGTERIIKCDALILSVGLIPENELAKSLEVPLSNKTKGPIVDQNFQTLVDGIYACGNSVHVNDLADYVSESGEIAGQAKLNVERNLIKVEEDKNFLYVVPQVVDLNSNTEKMIFYFRSKDEFRNKTLVVSQGDEILLRKKYQILKPPEMEKILISLKNDKNLSFKLED